MPTGIERTYVYNRRRFALVQDDEGWLIVTGRDGEVPVDRRFAEGMSAEVAWSRMLALAILCHPRPVCRAEIGGAHLAVVVDRDVSIHLAELDGPGGSYATAFADSATAMGAWQDRCCELARAALHQPQRSGG